MSEAAQEVLSLLRKVDLDRLGDSIRYLPPAQWGERMLFSGARDQIMLQTTAGLFPRNPRQGLRTHPIFVLRTVGNLGHRVCPCSSKRSPARRYIPQGTKLEITQRETDRDSYLVEDVTFTLPEDTEFRRHLFLQGRVPHAAIRGA
jgi:hypothetical protein